MDKTLLENAHEMAKDLFEVGTLDMVTMREFDVIPIEDEDVSF
jgi:hypothetical protein